MFNRQQFFLANLDRPCLIIFLAHADSFRLRFRPHLHAFADIDGGGSHLCRTVLSLHELTDLQGAHFECLLLIHPFDQHLFKEALITEYFVIFALQGVETQLIHFVFALRSGELTLQLVDTILILIDVDLLLHDRLVHLIGGDAVRLLRL